MVDNNRISKFPLLTGAQGEMLHFQGLKKLSDDLTHVNDGKQGLNPVVKTRLSFLQEKRFLEISGTAMHEELLNNIRWNASKAQQILKQPLWVCC
jgi:hypothetical protein